MSAHEQTLQTLCRQVNSEKIKERQDALSKIREVFARDNAAAAMDTSEWTVLFTNLHAAFAKELTASTKKGKLTTATTGSGATALKRLGEVASTVRWLTEKSVDLISPRAVKPLLIHLLRSMKYRSRLLEPVAVHYIKAVKTIVSRGTHLRYLEMKDMDTWMKVVEMAFNVILGDSLNSKLEDTKGDHEGEDEALLDLPEQDPSSESGDGQQSEDTLQPSNPRKRRMPERDRNPTPPSTQRAVGTRRPTGTRSVTPEQVASAAVLSVVLMSETAPLLSPDFLFIPAAILTRLSRFLSRYPGESTLHHDYLQSLSGALSQLALNNKKEVSLFAARSWNDLVSMWGTRTQSLKEGLVVVLRTLLPYLATGFDSDRPTRLMFEDGVNKLWKVLMGEADKRGVEGLSLDCIRLQLLPAEEESESGAFVAKTFRHGWNFDSGQALSWAILSLQTNCAEKLYLLSESIHSSTSDDGKRIKRENPITTLLSYVSSSAFSAVRAYRLQGLLFFIDQHWIMLHDDLRKAVIINLQQFLSLDDALVQSWTFLCLAAIGHAESTSVAVSTTPSQQLVVQDTTSWNSIWTHAMRRTAVPAVCRAACHAACVLLHHSKSLLTPQQVLIEIETLAKDLDIQGPSSPYDSSCSFLVLCMRVASHDVRLYRMQLEEKVLAWLTDSWRPGGTAKSRMAPYTVDDVLGVLGAICCLPKTAQVLCPMKLPDCIITTAMVEEDHCAVIRDYLLRAHLPRVRAQNARSDGAPSLADPVTPITDDIAATPELLQPRGRERRISAFLLKSLEDILQQWETPNGGRPTAEKTRASMDVAVIALLFEATLTMHGTRSNRRVQQAACGLVCLVIPHATDFRWTLPETALILTVLEPLVLVEKSGSGLERWHTLLPASTSSGIRQELLQATEYQSGAVPSEMTAARYSLQKAVFQSPDVEEMVNKVSDVLHTVLQRMLPSFSERRRGKHVDIDDKDTFGASELALSTTTSTSQQQLSRTTARREIVDICVTSLAVLPALKSRTSEPTRDKKLLDTVAGFELDDWLVVGPSFIENVKRQTLHMNANNTQVILERVGDELQRSRSAQASPSQLLVTTLLQATMHVWLHDDALGEFVESLCSWLCGLSSKPATMSWACRDQFVQFLESYIVADPGQTMWSSFKESEGDDVWVPIKLQPSELLPLFGADPDIRVRFRAAVANARLICNARFMGDAPMHIYSEIRAHLSVDLDQYERIITRLLCLSNIMVVSSAVRRGPLWHLLEICLHSQLYTQHVGTLLSSVAQRLNLTSSSLFIAYASQIAYSIKQTDRDFLQLPAHLLGYRDKREYAEATFTAFTPTNVLPGRLEDRARGRSLFKMHCQVTKKSPAEGIRQCFSEIIGRQIVSFLDHYALEEDVNTLNEHLTEVTKDVQDVYQAMLCQHADSIVASILRTLGDQDYSQDGPILTALQNLAHPSAAAYFRELTRYRSLHEFDVHEPNLPAFSTATVLRSLDWLKHHVPSVDQHSTTYHILHQLFADVGHSPLVNEQIRLLTAISVWASLHRDDFLNTTILRTFISGAASILPQLDLARTAQSLLEWGFSLYLQFESEETRLASVLIRVSCTAYDYSVSGSADVSAMGRDLLQWAETQVVLLWRRRSLRRQINQALSAWPAELSHSVQSKVPNTSNDDISAILNDSRISSNKFRLVQRLRDVDVVENVSGSDFWTLKACIPPKAQLSNTDLDAFCEYLVSHRGLSNSLAFAQTNIHTVRTRHARGIKRDNSTRHAPGDGSAAQQAIVVSLLTILEESSMSQVQLSYSTLRGLVSLLSSDAESWPAEYREELGFLKDYCRSSKPRPKPDISQFVNNHAWVDMASDFLSWIVYISPVLSDMLSVYEPFYAPLTSILQAHADFAEQVFPVLVHTLLQRERSEIVGARETQICKHLSGYFDRLLRADTTSIRCRRAIVDTILHLRYFVPTSSKDPMRHDALSYDKWLDVDYILLSRNAITCGAYTTALLCIELAAEYNGLEGGNSETEQIMYDIYGHIDEPDGFYGIQTHDLQKFLMQRFHHEKQWDKAFQFHGAKLEKQASSSRDVEGVVEALHAFGFDHLAMSTLNGTSSGATLESNGVAYQLGWRTETWDLPERPEHPDIGAPLYVALRAVYRERDIQSVNKALRRSLLQEMENLSELGTESVVDIKQVVQNLMCLHQVAQWQAISSQIGRGEVDVVTIATVDDGLEFYDLEAIMAVRISLLRSASQQEQREQIGDMLSPLSQRLSDIETSCLLRLSRAARSANQTQIAMNSVVRAQQLSPQTTFEVSEEFSEVLWIMKEPKLAVQYLANLLEINSRSGLSGSVGESVRRASAFARLGRWTSEASLEKAADIQSKYFDPAAEFATSHAGPDSTEGQEYAVIYHQYAMFADQQYHAIAKSPDALRWKFYAERKKQEVIRRQEELNKVEYNGTEWKRIARLLEKAGNMLREDQRQFQEHINTRDALLAKAIEMYSRSLEVSDKFDDDSAIRLCSLWFSNFDYEGDNFQAVVGKALRRIPSRKFVFLAHQLTARISDKSSEDGDQDNLQELVMRMCREHPFHSLYQVWCLQSDRKLPSLSSSRRQSGRSGSMSSQAARANAAANIFDKLRSIDDFATCVRDVEQVCRASLEWAVYPIKDKLKGKRSSGPYDIPQGLSILKLQDIQIPVITADTPIDPTTRYNGCVWIKSYEKVYTTAGGLNLPKISKCIGTDGTSYKQLFKGEGNDDLRQDAVMEQVFQLVNIILRRDRETVRRTLSVRDYKVIPLAPQAGLLEFVTNTSPLKDFLESGHRRYRPKDLTGYDIAKVMDDTCKAHKEDPGLPATLLEMYLDFTKRFKPVMRHYFAEKHRTPSSWFKMRLKYSRSVATNSIVGHILGLGDRHTSNILMDNSTGEVVHIDLGIAFDQGKMLPTPERVPFRLTRDMVDGLGTSGTQGVFQRCAEETLRVLREGSGVIVTVLEVFKHDPLHSWTASEFKVKRVQGTGDTDLLTEEAVRYALGMDMSSGSMADEHADRALNAVSRKLDKSMTVEYTVNELIAEATDVKNLATMYPFWYPHY